MVDKLKSSIIHIDKNEYAKITKTNDGTILEYYKGDKLHNSEGAARIVIIGNQILQQEYYVDGKRHNANGPAIKSKIMEYYYIEDKLHRDNEPAKTQIYEDGHKSLIYYQHGEIHRIGGPAYILIKNETILDTKYYLNNVEYSEFEYLLKLNQIKNIDSN